MIDTHCHLYSDELAADLDAVMKRAMDKGIQRFYMPAIDSSTTTAMLEVEKKYPNCKAMMGLHPCSVNSEYERELVLVEEWLIKRKFAAVGEIGLDLYWDKTYINEQYISFRKQADLALQYNIPIVIHSRNATTETIAVINEYRSRGLTGIFHCFGGSLAEAQQIIDAGFYLGIGGVVTYKNAGLAEVISQISLAHIVLETDAPYLAPFPFRGKRNESSYLSYIVQKIAECKNISIEEVERITTENALRLFKEDH